MYKVAIKTQLGSFTAWFSETGLARLEFPRNGTTDTPVSNTAIMSPQVRAWAALTKTALDQLLSGKPAKELPPLDLSAGTPFQWRVWKALQAIPAGQTWTYSQIGVRLKQPLASRAVGSACGANPIPVFVPCHRVLPKSGGLGGFSAGLQWKSRLLATEGIQLGSSAGS